MNHFKNVARKLGIKFYEDICPIYGDVSRQFASDVFSENILKYKENEEIINKIGKFCYRNNIGDNKN